MTRLTQKAGRIDPEAVIRAYQRADVEPDPELRRLNTEMLATIAPGLAQELIETRGENRRLREILAKVFRHRGVLMLPEKETDQ